MELPSLFFEQHPNPMLIYDFETLQILEVNSSAEEKYGYTRDEFRELTIEDIRPPEDIAMLREELKKIEDQPNEMNEGTFRHQTKDGEILHVQLSSQEFPAENKKARIVHINDLSEIIELKNEVEEAYQDQQFHIDNNPLGMVKYDKDFRIIEWSKRAEEKTGYTKDEVLGTSTFETGFFDEESSDFVKERMLDIASGEKDNDRFETTINIKNGSKMDVLIHASALRNPEGELKSVLAFIENITDRKDYERKLEKRERKYHRLFEDAHDSILVLDGATIIDCNKEAVNLFELPKEKLVGKTILDFSPEYQPDGNPSKQKAKQMMSQVRNEERQVFEWEHQNARGEQIDVEVSLNTIQLGSDEYYQAILRDLTEHKKMESELEAEQKRLKNAQRLARIGWWSYSPHTDTVDWSDELYNILNVEEGRFGSTFEAFYELVHPGDREKLQNVMDQLQKTTDSVDYMLRIGSEDQEEILYARCRAQSKINNQGEVVEISGVLQDVTEQKKAQDELKRREELFESLFRDSPVAIVMIDTDGNVQKINNSFEKLFGYSQQELAGKNLLEYQLPEERHDEISEIYENVFAEKGASKYYEDQRITKQGETKDLLVGALPVILDDEPVAAFGIYTDITKLRETEQSLQQSLKEKEVLLSEIHHRVKNNLAIISGLLMLEAMNWDSDSEVHKVLMQSKLRIHSMAKIHEKLYESEDFANLDLENYIEDLVNTIYASVNGSELNVDVDIDCDNIELNINQALPCALIVNELVTNSFKYAFNEDEKGKLEIRFKSNGKKIRLSISDSGPGLPDNFENMVDNSLGHRLVSQLVKQLEGDIEVNSGKDIGTNYTITFNKENKSGSSSNILTERDYTA